MIVPVAFGENTSLKICDSSSFVQSVPANVCSDFPSLVLLRSTRIIVLKRPKATLRKSSSSLIILAVLIRCFPNTDEPAALGFTDVPSSMTGDHTYQCNELLCHVAKCFSVVKTMTTKGPVARVVSSCSYAHATLWPTIHPAVLLILSTLVPLKALQRTLLG